MNANNVKISYSFDDAPTAVRVRPAKVIRSLGPAELDHDGTIREHLQQVRALLRDVTGEAEWLGVRDQSDWWRELQVARRIISGLLQAVQK